MQFDRLAAASHEFVGDLFILDREVEDVGFYRGASGVLVGASESGLDQLALVGLPDVAFVDELVEFAGLHSVTEDEVEPEVDESGQSQCQDDTGPRYDLAFCCHDSLFYRVACKLPSCDRGNVRDHGVGNLEMSVVVWMAVGSHVLHIVVD